MFVETFFPLESKTICSPKKHDHANMDFVLCAIYLYIRFIIITAAKAPAMSSEWPATCTFSNGIPAVDE